MIVYIGLVIILGAMLLMSISVDNQFQRIERKINTILEDTFDLLEKEKNDE